MFGFFGRLVRGGNFNEFPGVFPFQTVLTILVIVFVMFPFLFMISDLVAAVADSLEADLAQALQPQFGHISD